jgi:hypothetical protein
LSYRTVSDQLRKTGLLLLSDRALPSVVGLVAGPDFKGSWWGHEKGQVIWRILKRLDADPDVLVTRLVSGKVTYLHRRLWPDFLTVAASGEPWQTKGLTPKARKLLKEVNVSGEVRMDRYVKGKDPKKVKEAAHQIEERLLAYSDEIHTEKGSHAKILATWSRSPRLAGERIRMGDARNAKSSLESAVRDLGTYGGRAVLPWRKVI